MSLERAGSEIKAKMVPSDEECIDLMFVGEPWKEMVDAAGGNPIIDVPDENIVENYLRGMGVFMDSCEVEKTGRGESQGVGIARLRCDNPEDPMRIKNIIEGE